MTREQARRPSVVRPARQSAARSRSSIGRPPSARASLRRTSGVAVAASVNGEKDANHEGAAAGGTLGALREATSPWDEAPTAEGAVGAVKARRRYTPAPVQPLPRAAYRTSENTAEGLAEAARPNALSRLAAASTPPCAQAEPARPFSEWVPSELLKWSEPDRAPLRVAVLLSGGVDSTVALNLLRAAGHECTAFYLQIWFQARTRPRRTPGIYLAINTPPIATDRAPAVHRRAFVPANRTPPSRRLSPPGRAPPQEDFRNTWEACPWETDLAYATAACAQLGVPLEVVPLTKQYWDRVVSHSIKEISEGLTPNPDVLCNSRVKARPGQGAPGAISCNAPRATTKSARTFLRIQPIHYPNTPAVWRVPRVRRDGLPQGPLRPRRQRALRLDRPLRPRAPAGASCPTPRPAPPPRLLRASPAPSPLSHTPRGVSSARG